MRVAGGQTKKYVHQTAQRQPAGKCRALRARHWCGAVCSRCAATGLQCRVCSLPARLDGERAGSEQKCWFTRATENARVRCEGPTARRGRSA